MSPSGAARAAASVPIIVPPPGRFSITTVGPLLRPICSAIRRERMSGPLRGRIGHDDLDGARGLRRRVHRERNESARHRCDGRKAGRHLEVSPAHRVLSGR